MNEGFQQTVDVPEAWFRDLLGYINACIGDADGERAVGRNRMLSLTAGQVQCLVEARILIEAVLNG